MNESQATGQAEPVPDQPVDPNIQIKFTVIFGLLAAIPLVLFYFFGLENKPEGPASDEEIPRMAFTDITEEAGIRFTHATGAAGQKLLPETMGGGCAFFDFDRDGDQDILFVNSCSWPWAADSTEPQATMALYVNDGKGVFTDATAATGLDISFYGMGAAAGDYDNDGFPDLLITGVGSNRLLHNEGGRRFVDVTAAAGLASSRTEWSTSAAFVDYDRDGDLDLFICNYIQWSRGLDLSVDYRLPGLERAYGPPMNFSGAFPFLYRNEGKGKFSEVAAAAGLQVTNRATGLPLGKSLGVAPVDLDQDGWIDLVVANDTVQNFLFHNNGNGTFAEIGGKSGVAYDLYGSARGAMGIDTARIYDGDQLAISIGNFANESTAFYVSSRGPLSFTDEALKVGLAEPTRNQLTFGVFFFDYDLDGNLDLLTANGHIEPEIVKVHPEQTYAQSAQLFWNSGRKLQDRYKLVPETKRGGDLSRPLVGRGSAYADIDGDGDLDILITQAGGPPRLLRNDQKLGRNWVRIKLTGRGSNRDAIGAWVRLRSGGRVMARQVMGARGYLSQSELPLTFGLGDATTIEDAHVIWPDGAAEPIRGLRVGEMNEVTQRSTGG